VVRDFRSFLRECVLMVLDEGYIFGELKPTLELYLRNIESIGGVELAGTYSTRLAEVEDDLRFREELYAVHLPGIVDAKVDEILEKKEEQVARATEAMEILTSSIRESQTMQANIDVELEEATRTAGAQVEDIAQARVHIANAQRMLEEAEVAHAQLMKHIADMEGRRRLLAEQVEARMDDLQRVEEETRGTLAITDEEIRVKAQKDAEEQHQAALRGVEEKLRSLE
jgi:chromosome segregation ATPase